MGYIVVFKHVNVKKYEHDVILYNFIKYNHVFIKYLN